MSVGRATLTVGGFTALSRVAGFARDVLIAAALGAGPVADAFFVSLKLANFLRRLFAEGAFSAAFVPLFARLRAADGDRAALRFASEALSVLALTLAAVVLVGELLMPWLVRALATGFAPSSLQFELAVELGRVTFPYLLLISLAALVSSMLQAARRFAAAAFAPVLLNLMLIAILLATRAEGAAAARALAWGLVGAGVLQLAWVAAAAVRAGLAPGLAWPRLSAPVRRLLALIGPGIVGVGVVQINLLVSSWFATHLPAGTVAYLFYADRLVQLPLGDRRRRARDGAAAGVEPGRAARAGWRRACSTGRSSWRCCWRCLLRSGWACSPSRSSMSCSSAAPSARTPPWRPGRCWPGWRWACRPTS